MSTTVIQIVKEKLKAMGADGLVCPDEECGCKLDDLAPCGGDISECQPGWISSPTGQVEHDWLMWSSKEQADAESARAKQGGEA